MNKPQSLPEKSLERSRLGLAIGPANSASQATEWSRAVRETLQIGAYSLAFDGNFARALKGAHPTGRSDRPLPHYRLAPKFWRQLSVATKLRQASHLLNESNTPLIGDPRSSRFTDEIERYSSRGIQTGVVFHGSDIRDPELCMSIVPDAYFKDADPEIVMKLAAQARLNRESVYEAGVPTFVTTLDLLDHFPDATYLPICTNVENWDSTPPASFKGTPRVLHRPASKVFDTKGSKYITPVLEELENSGKIVLLRNEVVPHSQMRNLYAASDIVIDQVQSNAYGVTAIEAMSMGRLVVGNTPPQALTHLGQSVPIVEATPTTFKQVMIDLLSDPIRMQTIAAQGPSFVKNCHDGTRSARALSDFLSISQSH